MHPAKMLSSVLFVVLLLALVAVPGSEAGHHGHRGHGIGALLTAGLIAKVLENNHHGCHHG